MIEIDPQQVHSLVWDLDGTLIDSFDIFREIVTDIAPRYNKVTIPKEEMRRNYHGRLEDSLKAVLVGGLSDKELVPITAEFIRIQDGHYEIIDHHIFPDALALTQVAARMGLQQIIVTNRAHVGRLKASPRSIVERSGLRPLINKVICGDDSEYTKPDHRVFDVLTREEHLNPAQAMVIGDQFVDAQLALNIGAQGVLVERGGPIPHLEQLPPDWRTKIDIVTSLSEVRVLGS